jgi:hypothetical protein
VLARRAGRRDEPAVQHLRRLVELRAQLALQVDVAALGAEVAPERQRELTREDLAEPGDQFGLGGAAEVGDLAVGLEEHFLHHVAGVDLALEPAADLHARQAG